jgi:DNA-binding Lrp family transcriptional regulator
MILRMATRPLDAIDHHILRLLESDGRMSNAALAAKVGLSPSACLRRLHQLEADRVITGYAAIIAHDEVDATATVMVEIVLERQTAEHMQRFESAVRRVVEVRECYLMSGASDYLLRVEARDPSDYERVHRQLARLPAVERIKSSFTIRTVTRGHSPRVLPATAAASGRNR